MSVHFYNHSSCSWRICLQKPENATADGRLILDYMYHNCILYCYPITQCCSDIAYEIFVTSSFSSGYGISANTSRFSKGRVTIAAPIPAPLAEWNYCADAICILRTHPSLKWEDYALKGLDPSRHLTTTWVVRIQNSSTWIIRFVDIRKYIFIVKTKLF